MPETCNYSDCERPVQASDLCFGHYQQARRGQDLRPLQRYRKGFYKGLRIIRWLRHPYHPRQEPDAEDDLGTAEYKKIDWMVTRSEQAIDGVRAAQTVSVDDAVYAYWFEGYLSYATNEELVEVCDLLEKAIQLEYPHLKVVGFEKDTLSERLIDGTRAETLADFKDAKERKDADQRNRR